jgi:hypothetical protein
MSVDDPKRTSEVDEEAAKSRPLGRGIPVITHDAFNHLIASETGEYLTFVVGTVISVRAASGWRGQLTAKWTARPTVHIKASRFLS